MFSNIFLKILEFIRQCGKIWYSQTGHRWQYITAQKRCWLRTGKSTDTHI